MPSLQTTFVTTADGSLLRAVRDTISSSDELLLCVAFMSEAGVALLSKEFEAARRAKPRLLVTTSFGTTDLAALQRATKLGIDTRIYNPGGGTFHPKLYLGRTGSTTRAFIGSANMTAGLTANVEAGLSFEGDGKEPVLRSAWDWAEELWNRNDVTVEWPRARAVLPKREPFDPELYALIKAEVALNPRFLTLPFSKINDVTGISPSGLKVRTASSAPDSEDVPAWMFNVAWGYLKLHRQLSNQTMDKDLRIMRSSLVRAVLARLPGVTATKRGTLLLPS